MDFFHAFIFTGFLEAVRYRLEKKRNLFSLKHVKITLYVILSLFMVYSFLNVPGKSKRLIQNIYAMDKHSYDAILWLRNNVKKDSVVLCNVITGGNLKILSECISILCTHYVSGHRS